MNVRTLSVSVISDIHLATHACKAKSILKYLKSIQPETLVLNGDIIDSWRFSRKYFPKSHLKVVRQLIKMLEKGTNIFYVTGNHDDFLRKFNQTQLGKLKIVNQLVLKLDGQETWIFHGDIFDHIIHHARWLAKFGAATYGFLSLIDKAINYILCPLGVRELIIYGSIKKRLVKEKQQFSRFEKTIGKIAVDRNYQTVICGHTHIPKDKLIMNEQGKVRYINCGDWVESFTAAEYNQGEWDLFYYTDDENNITMDEPYIPDKKQVLQSLYQELAVANFF